MNDLYFGPASGEFPVTEAMRIISRKRARDRRKNGGTGKMGAVWEPDWFTSTHALANKAAELCDRHTLLVVSVLNEQDEPDEEIRDRFAAMVGKDYAVFLGTEEDAA